MKVERWRGQEYSATTDGRCPICDEVIADFDDFHIWRVIRRPDGGSRHASNLLKICRTCQVLLAHGSVLQEVRGAACMGLMLAHWGLLFSLQSRRLRGNAELRAQIRSEGRRVVDRRLREAGAEAYRANRALIERGFEAIREYAAELA
jgi:hypothetical protein